MASLRNLAIVILRARGDRNIAAALRHNARDAIRLLPLLGITSPWTRHPGTCRGSAGSRHPGQPEPSGSTLWVRPALDQSLPLGQVGRAKVVRAAAHLAGRLTVSRPLGLSLGHSIDGGVQVLDGCRAAACFKQGRIS